MQDYEERERETAREPGSEGGRRRGVTPAGVNSGRLMGRPRVAGPRDQTLTPREEIIAVATQLFAERGFAQTTMRDIAHAAGLRQSSLYYYFNRKELILEASFSVNTAPLDFMEHLEGRSPGLRLYRFVRFDTRQLCLSPLDVNEIERLANRHPGQFQGLWQSRQRLHDRVAALIQEGVDSGQFLAVDVQLTTLGVTSFNEGVQNWFRAQRQHRPGGESPFSYPPYDVEQVSAFLAGAALRLLLRRPGDLATIERQAADFDDAAWLEHVRAGRGPGPKSER